MLKGEVVFMFAYDVAYDMKRQPIEQLLGQPVDQFEFGADKKTPRDAFFFRPQMVQLPPIEMTSAFGILPIRRIVKLFPVGAISVSIGIPFAVNDIEDLIDWHDLMLDNHSVRDHAQTLAEKVRTQLLPYCIGPVANLGIPEEYTVFCLYANGENINREQWLQENRRKIAALLNEEKNYNKLSEQECMESTASYLSYYDSDLSLVDWDTALIIDRPENIREKLHIMALANVQLMELKSYDNSLDNALERAYRDMENGKNKGRVAELRQTRIDMARLSDEIFNITKFFGDWYLARLYKALFDRFHLSDWQKVIDEKLKTLDNLYMLLKQDNMNRWMLILESTIVLLFIVDVVLLFVGK